MNHEDLILAALAAGGQHASYRPVQVQKLFFLIDREISNLVDGPHFNFRPYDYGPFDQRVYLELEDLTAHGLAVIQPTGRYQVYSLSPEGFDRGSQIVERLDPEAKRYLERAARWVLALSFQQLVSAIYKKYPDMKARSIFRE